MRDGYPSDDELRENFEEVLAAVLSGDGPRTATGLDDVTQTALWAIFKAYPDVTPELVDAAKQGLAGQLDGSNAARWEADMEKWFQEREQRKLAREQQERAE